MNPEVITQIAEMQAQIADCTDAAQMMEMWAKVYALQNPHAPPQPAVEKIAPPSIGER